MKPLTQEWREEHVRKADEAMDAVAEMMVEFNDVSETDNDEIVATVAMVQLLISLAQAHYQAANVRAKALI